MNEEKTDTKPNHQATQGRTASTCSVGLVIGPYGHVDSYNLECGSDGIIRVKDGRSLDEYINNPHIVQRRRENEINHQDFILVSASVYETGTIPHCA